MSRWVIVAHAGDLSPGRGRTVQVGTRALALFNDGGDLFAIDDTCPHQGASLGEGTLHQGRVICPWHQWVFEVRSGRCATVPDLAVERFAVRVQGGAIEVEMPEPADSGPARV
jgi:NAD(P)H-dependent nitrite reductase small subunit